MTFQHLLKRTEQLVSDNSTTILTVVAVVGTAAVGVFSGRASYKARAIIDQEEYDRRNSVDLPAEVSAKEKALLVWKLYIPAVGVGVLTIACIIGSNRIGTGRAAALATAFSLSERAQEEYRLKVREKLGEKKEKEVQEEVVRERILKNPPNGNELLMLGDGNVPCYDTISGRYFESNMEALRKAQNDVNYEINHNMYCSLYDFWQKIGLDATPWSNEVGWNVDNQLELNFSSHLAPNGKPMLAVNYTVSPVRDYDRCM